MSTNVQNYAVRAHQTPNYTWTSEHQLGRGSAGQVFVGYRKVPLPACLINEAETPCIYVIPLQDTAEKVAIKVLKDRKSMDREVEALSKLRPHKNLVAFYGIEYVSALIEGNGWLLASVGTEREQYTHSNRNLVRFINVLDTGEHGNVRYGNGTV